MTSSIQMAREFVELITVLGEENNNDIAHVEG